MAEQGGQQLARSDVESLAEKLEVFSASLTEGERAVLANIVVNAANATSTEDTAGQTAGAFSSPLAASLAYGANLHGGSIALQEGPRIVNPGQLRAKDINQFQGFLAR